MPKSMADNLGPKISLDQISTRWGAVGDAGQFLLRYGTAIQQYLLHLLRNEQDADDVSQEIMLRVVQNGFGRARPDRGRFRDYLKKAVRNAALSHLRRKRGVADGDDAVRQMADPATTNKATDQIWLAEWKRCVLEKAWRGLESHQHRSAGNLFYTVLKLTVDFPDEDSQALALRVSATICQPMRAEAFRKQLSRARRMFAELLLDEIAQTLQEPTPNSVLEELAELGLMRYVEPFLPEKWAKRSGPTAGE